MDINYFMRHMTQEEFEEIRGKHPPIAWQFNMIDRDFKQFMGKIATEAEITCLEEWYKEKIDAGRSPQENKETI
jgi:hypothetical protein